MANRRTLAIAVFSTLLAALVCLTLMGFEASLLSERFDYSRRRATSLRTSFMVRAVREVSVFALDELITPELIQKIQARENNTLAPPQVHMVWIGDIAKAPSDRLKYTERGYNLTVHTSAEEILDGFHPYVLSAYQQAVPKVVGFDFLKLALLYKYGGFAVDADTSPAVPACEFDFPSDCDLIFGKESNLQNWKKPVFREQGGPTYGFARPFQVLNWAMAASKPRNPHVKWLLKTAMMHFFGLRDMEDSLIQDISGSGLLTDYVALLHEREGRNYRKVFDDHSKYVPVDRLCLTDGFLYGKWIKHAFLASWKKAGHHKIADLIFPYKLIEHDA